jgi:hypothetical protein
MSRFAIALSAAAIVIGLADGTAFLSTRAEAANKMTADEKDALKEKAADCRKQAREHQLRRRASRKFVRDCVANE